MSTIVPYIYWGIGGLFLLYFIVLWIHCGHIPAFGWFWTLSGAGMINLGLFTKDYAVMGPDGITTVFYDENITAMRSFCIDKLPFFLILLAVTFFIAVYVISSHGTKLPAPNADYVIILGAHVNGIIPSRALKSRIRAAYRYLADNPDTKAILTGGRGRGEHITEALCMKRELLSLGIEETRLFLEDTSTTTKENIHFAKKIIDQRSGMRTESGSMKPERLKDLRIIVVTNDFHTLRGICLAKKAGFGHVEALGTPSSPIMKPHYYTREFLSWIKLGVVLLIKQDN